MKSHNSKNLLLGALSRRELDDASNHLHRMLVKQGYVFYEPNQRITYVYFPLNGVVSLVNELTPGEIVEFATVGWEGMVGLALLLETAAMPSRAIMQIPGEVIRMPASTFQRLRKRHPDFQTVLMRYTMALMNQTAQTTSCNRLHEVQERCARWLLQSHDRVEGDSFLLTQEFLGQMLGVHRPTVSIAARMLQQAGLISYSRGVITVVNRNGLEQASCECYRRIAQEYKKLLPRGG